MAEQAAAVLGISLPTANRDGKFAKGRLDELLSGDGEHSRGSISPTGDHRVGRQRIGEWMAPPDGRGRGVTRTRPALQEVPSPPDSPGALTTPAATRDSHHPAGPRRGPAVGDRRFLMRLAPVLRWIGRGAAGLLLAARSSSRPRPAATATPTRDVMPPNSKPYGHTSGEWSAAFWQPATSLPLDAQPVGLCHDRAGGRARTVPKARRVRCGSSAGRSQSPMSAAGNSSPWRPPPNTITLPVRDVTVLPDRQRAGGGHVRGLRTGIDPDLEANSG